MAAVIRSRFYFFAAIALALVIFAGFSRTYYLAFLFDVRPLTLLMHVHGLVFTAWALVFVAQTRLIAASRYDLHMKLGLAGVALAAAIVVVGVMTALVASTSGGTRAFGLSAQRFVILPLADITFFAVFAAAGVSLRRKRDLHKRFMMLAMISVLGPAVGRIVRALATPEYLMTAMTAVPAAFVIAALIHDRAKNRVVHPVYLIGGTLIVISWPLRVWFAHTDTWGAISLRIREMGTFLIS